MAKKQFVPHNMQKYMGKHLPVMRSSWEERFARWLDANPKIEKWGSENIVIPYFDPVRNKKRRYYPDFYFEVKQDDKVAAFLIEIKPFKETIPPTKKGRKSRKTLIYEDQTYRTNVAKWNAALQWCSKMGVTFKIMTEKQLFGGK